MSPARFSTSCSELATVSKTVGTEWRLKSISRYGVQCIVAPVSKTCTHLSEDKEAHSGTQVEYEVRGLTCMSTSESVSDLTQLVWVVAALAAAVEVEAAVDFLLRAEAAVLRVIPFFFMASLDFSVQGCGQVGVVWPVPLQL